MIELKKIKLSDTLELPYICDLNVLKRIQCKYGSVTEFEKRILNFETVDQKIRFKEPDLEAVIFGLFCMTQEGYRIDVEENGAKYSLMNENEMLTKTERSFIMLAYDIRQELKRCFTVKK